MSLIGKEIEDVMQITPPMAKLNGCEVQKRISLLLLVCISRRRHVILFATRRRHNSNTGRPMSNLAIPKRWRSKVSLRKDGYGPDLLRKSPCRKPTAKRLRSLGTIIFQQFFVCFSLCSAVHVPEVPSRMVPLGGGFQLPQ